MPGAANFAQVDNGAACVTTSFQSFRLDVNAGTSIVDIRPLGEYSWAAVQCSDGMCLVYDIQSGELLGRLALYSGMTSRQVEWKISNFKESITPKTLLPQQQQYTEDDLGYRVDSSAPAEATSEAAEVSEESGEKTFPDPNAFVRIPPGKRAAKYAVSKDFNWAKSVEANSVAVTSSLGFHCMYWRNGQPVLALFRVEDVFMNFYPQLASLLQSKSAYNIDTKLFFKRLSPLERTDPVAAAQRVHELYDVFGHHMAGGTAKPGRRHASSGSRGGTGAGDNLSLGSSGTAGSMGSTTRYTRTGGTAKGGTGAGSRNASRSNSFTKQNLEALQMNLGGTSDVVTETENRIITCSHERLSEPTAEVRKSALNSSVDRTMRKNRLMNRLSAISNQF